eukprot:TRINITY_DN2446_c0_g1_i2.p1 TRINITY_DN2446_c0_g1~~TRINITY_DN2446_c0_g1_i2.p1  ORF type:complete len:492 (-),score=137.49 TRINITY_DN2446_c0_g1_i2:206-1681(-)
MKTVTIALVFCIFALASAYQDYSKARKCVSSLQGVLESSKMIQKSFTFFRFPSIFGHLQTTVPFLKNITRHCQDTRGLGEYLELNEVSNINSCIEDVIALIPEVQKTISDAEGHKVFDVLQDLGTVANSIKKLAQDCQSLSTVDTTANITFYQYQNDFVGYPIDEIVPPTEENDTSLFVGDVLAPEVEENNNTIVVETAAPEEERGSSLFVGDVLAPEYQDDEEFNSLFVGDVLAPEEEDNNTSLIVGDVLGPEVEENNTSLFVGDVLAPQEQQSNISDYLDSLFPIQVGNVSQCVDDIASLIPIVQKLVDDANNNRRIALIQDIQEFAAAYNQTLLNCEDTRAVIEYQTQIGEFTSCVEDLVNLFQEINNTIYSLSTNNFTAIVRDVELLIISYQNITRDCQFGRQIDVNFQAPSQQCIADLKQIANDAVSAYNGYKQGNFGQVISSVQDAITVLGHVEEDCNTKKECQRVCSMKKVCSGWCSIVVVCGC